MDLSQLTCEVCKGNVPPITQEDIHEYMVNVPEWKLITINEVDRLTRTFFFDNFNQAWMFTNQVSAIAENEGHHPEIVLEWGKCTVTWWSHKIKGLHINDFICASKTNDLLKAADEF